MEIRGLGILNIRDLFGLTATAQAKKIELVVRIESWDAEKEYDRLGVEDESVEILGVRLPSLLVPVSPGRNLATIVEVAVRNHLLKLRGVHSASELVDRQSRKAGEPATTVTTPSGRGRRANIVILTGLSGAGKSTAAKAFEDLGYYCADNLPPVLLPKIVEVVSEARGDDARIAMGVDVRGVEFLPDLSRVLEELRDGKNDVQVLFLDAADDVLLRRFSETRRVHPVAARGAKEAIRKERVILSPLREMSDAVIDTSQITVHQLRDTLVRRFRRKGARGLQVSIVSFGFRYGIPVGGRHGGGREVPPEPQLRRLAEEVLGPRPEGPEIRHRGPDHPVVHAPPDGDVAFPDPAL